MTFSPGDLQSTETFSNLNFVFQLLLYFKVFNSTDLNSVKSQYNNTENDDFSSFVRYEFRCPNEQLIADCSCQFDGLNSDPFIMVKFIENSSCVCIRHATAPDTSADVAINCMNETHVFNGIVKNIYFDKGYLRDHPASYYQDRKQSSFFFNVL
jgi:hypothetical protein